MAPADPIPPEHDLYALLGVDRQADPEDIAAAYTAHLRRLRPTADTPEAERTARVEEAKRLRAARAVLLDPASRAVHDAQLEAQLDSRPDAQLEVPEPAPPASQPDPMWRPPIPPPARQARIASGAAVVAGPACLALYLAAFVGRSLLMALLWAMASAVFGALVWMAAPAFPRTPRGQRAVVARTAFAVGLSPVVGILSVPALLRAAFDPVRAARPPGGRS